MARGVRSRQPWCVAIAVALVGSGVIGTSCAARGPRVGEDGVAAGPSNASTPLAGANGSGPVMFGDLPSPCGPGNAKVAEADAGKGTDKLYVGVNTDKGLVAQPGMNREMFDASNAFISWCNAQGGIAGLKIAPVDLDAKLIEVEQTMSTACRDTFAMVGGGNVSDNLQFSGRPESDIDKCGLIDVPAFMLTAKKANSTSQYSPFPSGGGQAANTFYQVMAASYPEQMADIGFAFPDYPPTKQAKDLITGIMGTVDGVKVTDEFPFSPIGQDWVIIAQKIKKSGVKALTFVGEPGMLSLLLRKLAEVDAHPLVIVDPYNLYDPLLLDTGTAAEGVKVRISFPPFEEADQNPAVATFLSLMDRQKKTDGNAKTAAFGLISMSSWLLFATAANTCAGKPGSEITRSCVMETISGIHSWTAGGLHAPTDPGARTPGTCIVVLEVKGGRFERWKPALGSADDNGHGYLCRDDALVSVKQ